MPHTQDLQRRAATAVTVRRTLLIVNALAYIGGVGACAVLYSGRADTGANLIVLINLVCWPVWLLSLIAILLAMRDLRKHKAVGRLVDDERTAEYSHLAYRAGYWVLLAVAALCLALSFVTHIDARAWLAAVVACGVAAPSLTYAFAYRG